MLFVSQVNKTYRVGDNPLFQKHVPKVNRQLTAICIVVVHDSFHLDEIRKRPAHQNKSHDYMIYV